MRVLYALQKFVVCVMLLCSVCGAYASASDVIFDVTVSGTTFTITRSTTTYPTTVYYRTCNGSAVGGVHFQEKSGEITFAVGESSKTVTITKLTPANTTIDAYDEADERYFFLEVWNSCTSPIYKRASIAKTNSVSRTSIYDKTVAKSESFLGVNCDGKSQKEYSMEVFTNQFDDTRKKYLAAVGQSYQYAFRCLVDYKKTASGATPDITMVRIFDQTGNNMAFAGGFKMIKPLDTHRSFSFPVKDVGDNTSTTVTNPWNHNYDDLLTYQNVTTSKIINGQKYGCLSATNTTGLIFQYYRSSCGAENGSLRPYIYVCLYDNTKPTLKSIAVNTQKIYSSGETIYIALRFDEIVNATQSSFTIPGYISGTSGNIACNFSYVGGTGTNTLYFSVTPTLPSSVTTNVDHLSINYQSYFPYITDWTGNKVSIGYTECNNINIGQKYTVTLTTNGGTINYNDVPYYTYGVGATLPTSTNMTRTGYTFAGWYENSSFTGSKVTSISTYDTGDKHFYAKWTANTYAVTLDNQSASSSGTATVTATYNTAMPTIIPPTKTGYTFNGYYSSANGQGMKYYNADGTSYRNYTLTSTTTLYASWTVKTPTITFDNQGATSAGTESTIATYGADMPAITIPSKTGYTFGGYFTGINGSGTQYYFEDGTGVMTCDLEFATTLYAQWTVNKYTVTLNSQSATTDGTTSIVATYGSAMPSITIPTKTGYSFGGYYTYTDGSGIKYYYDDGSSARNYNLTYATTLYAYWITDTYSITYVNNNGTIDGTPTTTYQYGNTVTLPSISRDGCTFGGWFDNANCEGTDITAISSSEFGDKTFYAKWTPKTYSVVLHPGDGSITAGNVSQYTYGVGAILPMSSNMSYSGFGFAGWYDNEEFEGSVISEITVADFGNKEYWAKWEEGSYPVVLNSNEGIVRDNVVNYVHGTVKPLPIDVVRTGYDFEGWYENSSCIGIAVTEIPIDAVGAKTYWAKWREKNYTIAFVPNEGTINDEIIPTQYTFSVGASLPVNVTRNGYSFEGWYDNVGLAGQPVALIRSSDYGNKTYYAKWKIKSYSIAYYNNGGDIEDEVVPLFYTFGDEVTLPSQVYKEGYEFLGWYDNPNLYNSPVTKIEEVDFGNKTYYAKWQVNNYKITFVTNGGAINSGNINKYTYGYGVTLPTDVIRTGYTFGGWFSDEALTSDRIEAVLTSDIGDKTYYAKWTNNQYNIILNPNEGVISNNVLSYVYGNEIELPAEISREGYTFGGWYASPNFDGSPVSTILSTDYGNKEFWAKWFVNSYNVTLVNNGGIINSGNISSYTYGIGASLPTDITRTGYRFGGWFNDEDFSSMANSAIAVNETGNKIYYAQWIEIDYNIIYNANGGKFDENQTYETSYNYGDEVTLPIPTRDGYEFAGWYNNSNLIGTEFIKILATEIGNKEFWAKWNVNTYDVTLNANDGIINSGNITNYVYGNVVLLTADVSKAGHTFVGWYESEDFSGDPVTLIGKGTLGDKTYYANWNVNSYGITLVTNEGVITEDQNIENYEYGTGATLPTDVTKEGYTFAGWYTNSSYIGGSVASVLSSETGDKTFYAKWTVNEYKVSADYDKVMGTVTGEDYYEYKSTATLKAIANDGYEFVGWNDNELKDERIQLTVTKDTTLVANFKEKEKVQIAGSLEIPTLKTEREAQPIDLSGLFTTTEGGEVTYTASSSAPNVVSATVSEGKLFLTVYEYEGEAEITVTATLPNGEKNFMKATAEVILACNIQVEETITNVSCYGESDGEIALKVTNAAEPYTTLWTGATATTDTIKDVSAGNYSVEIMDAENCSFTKTYSVTEPEEMKLSAKIKHPTCDNADGSITITLTGAENASFAWSDESTNQNIANLKKGDYSVVITNTETGCQISDSYTLVEPEAPVISIATTVATACNEANGAVYISTNSDDLRYMWSNSKTTKDLENVRAGDYTLEVVDSKNCKALLNVTVPSIKLKQPEIALVTVSQQSGKNLVVWLKENTDLIDYYTIYREDTAKNKFDKVVDVPYSELSVYEDLAANPMERAWKYKMTATDVCGEETAMSDYHSSLHLMKVKSLGVENHLMWDQYEGIDFDSYVILRKTKVKGVVSIDTLATVPSSLDSYTDTLPARGTTSYYVGVKLPETINPKTQFLKAESGPFVIALSNIAEVENYVAVQSVVKSNTEVYSIGHTIYVKNAEGKSISLFDNNGRAIERRNAELSTEEFSVRLDGVYFVRVDGESFAVLVR